MAAGATVNADYYFLYAYPMSPAFTDTAGVYIVNNIFEGNGASYFINCHSDFSLYSDYNVVYNFSKYIGDLGTLIGTTNDLTTDPLFIDNDLHIGSLSPAINNGATPALFEFIPALDFNGIARPLGGDYDIGAYETE